MLSPRGEDLTSSLTTSAIAPRTSGDGAVRWTGDPIQAHVSPMRGDPMTNDSWSQAIDRMLARVQDTMARVKEGFPHWADPETGQWTATPDGDWTGGYWIGMLWLAATATGDARYRAGAEPLAERLRTRISAETVFKSFPAYYGAALAAILHNAAGPKEIAIETARSLAGRLYSPTLKLVPLGWPAGRARRGGPGQCGVPTGGWPMPRPTASPSGTSTTRPSRIPSATPPPPRSRWPPSSSLPVWRRWRRSARGIVRRRRQRHRRSWSATSRPRALMTGALRDCSPKHASTSARMRGHTTAQTAASSSWEATTSSRACSSWRVASTPCASSANSSRAREPHPGLPLCLLGPRLRASPLNSNCGPLPLRGRGIKKNPSPSERERAG